MTTSSARSALTFFTVPLMVSIHRSELTITRSLLAADAGHRATLTASASAIPSWPKIVRIDLQRRLAAMPVCRLLIGVRHFEDGGLIERLADELESDRQPGLGEPAGDGDAREARQVDRDREDVREVHLERVLGLLPELERRRRLGGGGDHLTPFEGLLEVPPDQRPNLLRLEIVGVVVAGR